MIVLILKVIIELVILVFILINGYYCIVFIHFYSASHSMSLLEALPTTAIDTVSGFYTPKHYRQL